MGYARLILRSPMAADMKREGLLENDPVPLASSPHGQTERAVKPLIDETQVTVDNFVL